MAKLVGAEVAVVVFVSLSMLLLERVGGDDLAEKGAPADAPNGIDRCPPPRPAVSLSGAPATDLIPTVAARRILWVLRSCSRKLADGCDGAGCKRLAMATPSLEIAFELPREQAAPMIARRRVRHALDGVLESQQLCDLAVVVSELVTNAVVHGQGAIHLRIELCGGELKGEVSDEGRGFELQARDVEADQLHIRGLFFVQRYTTRWGFQKGTGRVWFEMPPASTPHVTQSRSSSECDT